jgi:N-hydroxyarylamine O-acetyltransferase
MSMPGWVTRCTSRCRWRPATTCRNHQWLSTSPDSGFVKVAMAERRDATGVDVIRGLVLTRIGQGASSGEPLTKRSDWFAALADVFDLRFDASDPAALDQLWNRTLAGHRAWEAAGRT